MSKLLRQNVGGTDYTMVGCTLTGVCASAASDYVKSVTLSDGDVIADGMTVVVTFANGNTAGIAPASQTIYSSDQVNYFSDSGLTQPFTLAPAGCYTIEYTGAGNAYTYQSFPVIQIGNVSAPLCNAQGHKTSGAVWAAGDVVSLLYSGGKFFAETAGQGGQSIITAFTDLTPYAQRINADRDKAVINKLIGASFANNQLIQNGSFVNSSNWTLDGATFSVSGGVASVTGTTTTGGGVYQDYRASNGHKLLFMLDIKTQVAGTRGAIVYFGNTAEAQRAFETSSTSFESFAFCAAAVSSGTYFRVRLRVQTSGDTNQYRNVQVIDLTQMFGFAIADRIYAMEQSSVGSGVAWIKSFGFFNKSYYDYNTGNNINVRPSAHKVSASIASRWKSRNQYSQYTVCLFADALLKPDTTYTLYFRGASGAGIYVNENLFGSQPSVVLDGTLQSRTYTTLGSLPVIQKMTESGLEGWVIFKNRGGNTVVPSFTEFYICEQGINADPTYIASYPLADTELRGIPQLDANNNLIYDGDVYYPSGDVIRKYAAVELSTLTKSYHLSGGSTGGLGWVDFSVSSLKQDTLNMLLSQPALPCKTGNVGWQSTTPCMTAGINDSNVVIFRIYETSGMSQADFDAKYNSAILIYELAAPTTETVAGYTNPQTCIRHGAEEFVDTRPVPIPTGHETDYAIFPDWLSDNIRFL